MCVNSRSSFFGHDSSSFDGTSQSSTWLVQSSVSMQFGTTHEVAMVEVHACRLVSSTQRRSGDARFTVLYRLGCRWGILP